MGYDKAGRRTGYLRLNSLTIPDYQYGVPGTYTVTYVNKSGRTITAPLDLNFSGQPPTLNEYLRLQTFNLTSTQLATAESAAEYVSSHLNVSDKTGAETEIEVEIMESDF